MMVPMYLTFKIVNMFIICLKVTYTGGRMKNITNSIHESIKSNNLIALWTNDYSDYREFAQGFQGEFKLVNMIFCPKI